MGELALLIPLMGIGLGFFGVWTHHKQKVEKIRAVSAAKLVEKGGPASEKIARLEDRVAVLERIVTDSGYNVSAQIEALRDVRRAEDQGSGVPLHIQRKERA